MTDQHNQFPRINQLRPLDDLDRSDWDYLLSAAQIRALEPRTLVTAEEGVLVYLLEGEVSLLSGGFVTESFTHLQQRALTPLFNESLDEDSAVLTSHGHILEVDRVLFEGLYSQQQAAAMQAQETDLSQAETELFQQLLNAFSQKKLDLPALPEAAFKIRQAINSPDIGTTEIVEIVQSDPVLSARLVKVANSPLYGTWREIKTVRDAVRRLGLETTRNLSFSLSVKQLFEARTSLIKNTIHELYQASTGIAAIAFAAAESHAPHLDPDQALLSGLIHNLGMIPILKYIDRHPSMMQSTTQLGKSIENLLVPVSTLILNEWNFDPSFIEVVEQANNWQRDTEAAADYCDVVIAARVIYLQQKGESPVEELGQVPAIRKLNLLELDADGNEFIDEAQNKIDEMQRLLQMG